MASTFHEIVMDTSGDIDHEVIERATAGVLAALRDRLTAQEADDIGVQLPAEIRALWAMVEPRARKEPATSEPAFYERVAQSAGLAGLAEARWITLAVFAALKRRLGLREAAVVVSRLPEDVRLIWLEAPGTDLERVGGVERRVLELEKNLGRAAV